MILKEILIRREFYRRKSGHESIRWPWEEYWHHPGGKLIELGPASLNDMELLSILIAPGIKGRPAEKIAEGILFKFGSYKGLANQPLEKFLKIKTFSKTKNFMESLRKTLL